MTEIVHISIGELWDKYSILLIKTERVTDPNKLHSIHLELDFLDKNMNKYPYLDNQLFIDLKHINEQLWDIEDHIRTKEFNKEFDEEFIQLARNIYIINDERALCKQQINSFFGSQINEVKNYKKYI